MFPAVARRLAARRLRPLPQTSSPNFQQLCPFIRNASTKPPIKARVKTQITNAIVNPAPPVLARFPKIYWTVRYIIYAIGGALAWHIFCEYFFTLSQAEGISMLPTINATGDWLLLSKRYRKGRGVVVGDIVSFKHPIDEHTRSVKRVIGMPGDIVLRDSPDKSGQMIQVPDGHCYVVGDNLKFSRDSRMFGPLPLGLVKAKVLGKLSTSERAWTSLTDDGLQPAGSYEDEADAVVD